MVPLWWSKLFYLISYLGRNKSDLASKVTPALKILDYKYPGVYSRRPTQPEDDQNDETPKKEKKAERRNFLANTITEAVLSKHTNHTDVLIVNPDDDSALKLLSYYTNRTVAPVLQKSVVSVLDTMTRVSNHRKTNALGRH